MTPGDSIPARNPFSSNPLAPEVARHQWVSETGPGEFDSFRAHQTHRSTQSTTYDRDRRRSRNGIEPGQRSASGTATIRLGFGTPTVLGYM